ncbi:hypothetical protein RSSM_01275 [Rhodopirellula sallentina SM41]|uniref:Uncharacterized protein n=1 Tax=Rhodopirellula sallentina SM41 TaxID=1263870 RepID=M5UMR0_9BACT|nr:hypothetical protein RSSM_01275 [Rhodopirellula sallentina SM41]
MGAGQILVSDMVERSREIAGFRQHAESLHLVCPGTFRFIDLIKSQPVFV